MVIDDKLFKAASVLRNMNIPFAAKEIKDGCIYSLGETANIIIRATLSSSGYAGRRVIDMFDLEFIAKINGESYYSMFSEEPIDQMREDFRLYGEIAKKILENHYSFKRRKVLWLMHQKVLTVNIDGMVWELPRTKSSKMEK